MPGRRRSPAHLALGALLVVACALGFAVTAARLDHRSPVLALARAVAVGQILAAGDLRAAPVSAGVGVDSIPASASDSVIGRAMAVSLPAGALLTRAELGTASIPSAGDALAALALKPGQFPPDLTAGAHVRLLAAAATSQQASPSVAVPVSGWAATVTGVQPSSGGQGSVVTVLLAQADAVRVAALGSGQVSLVVVAGG